MKIQRYSTRKRARIEIIPLIDIIFFLLATFVMVSLSMVRDRGIAVSLPSAGSGAAQGESDYIAITLTDDGSLFVNKQQIQPGELQAAVQQLLPTMAEPRVVINGDQSASLGKAVDVLDQMRALGISKVSVRTKNP